MKKALTVIFLSWLSTCQPQPCLAQCPPANNLSVWHESDKTITLNWSNSLHVGQVLFDGVPYADGNSGLSMWNNLGAIVAEKCVIATSCYCTFTAGQVIEITVRNYCNWPNMASFSDQRITYQLNSPIDCEKKKGKKNK